ncbi:hypothetical protein JOC54_000235 [Alkalihalobacillus xiaoxiensis]|uniref:Uncharacterized protein n=1 Tax=Shouchella xiaoxiensis TaxID=766895 RepID=A0ABS2SNA9_9BACI|nr:hypothetical protein [Shouchella xiaoxiensis]MBM7837004.1 hypothetical protein [Shouchella xiaoxiensis]
MNFNGFPPQYQYNPNQVNRNSHETANSFNGYTSHQANDYQQMQMQQTNNGHFPQMNQSNQQHTQGMLKDQCQQMIDHHVELNMTDGQSIDGILTEVREDGIMLLVGENIHQEESRQFGGRWYRRYRPRFFPFGGFGGIGFYPYFFPPFFY